MTHRRQFICLVIVLWVLYPTLAAQVDVDPVFESPSRVSRVAMLDDGSFLLLEQDSSTIREHRKNGELVRSVEVASSIELPELHLLDFGLGEDGGIVALASATKGESDPCAHVFEVAEYGTKWIGPIDRSLQAWKVRVDGAGNYYLVGLPTRQYLALVSGESIDERVRVVHRFSPDGQSLGSFLPIEVSSQEDLVRKVLSPIVDRSSFVVLPSGDAWFLWRDFTSGVPIYDRVTRLFRIGVGGDTTEVSVSPPPDGGFMVGIHSYKSKLAIEWSRRDFGSGALLTRLNGSVLAEVSTPGRIAALGEGNEALVAMAFGCTGFRVYRGMLEPPNQ